MTNIAAAVAQSVSAAAIEYYFNDTDDLRSIAWHLTKQISPSLVAGADFPAQGEAYVYVEPIEGTFRRPSITLQLVDSGPRTPWPARNPASFDTLAIAIRISSETRRDLMQLTDKVKLALGSRGGENLRIPMYAFWEPPGDPLDASGNPHPQVAFRLGRFLRVMRESLSTSLEEPDDDRLWTRTIQARLTAPRSRNVPTRPTVRQVTLSLHGNLPTS